MMIRALNPIEVGGRSFQPGAVIDDTIADQTQMLDWIQICDAEEMDDSGTQRGAKRGLENALRTPKEFVDFCTNAIAAHWGYVWGGRGKRYDAQERDYLYKTYHGGRYDHEYYYVTQWQRWENHDVCDCSGLVEAFSGRNRTAQGFYESCTKRGKIGTLPDDLAGALVFRESGERMAHVGVYIGGGKVIESESSSLGVVKTKLALRDFTHWGKPDFIKFNGGTPQPEPKPAFELKRDLRWQSPYMRGEDVRGVQKALIDHGFPVGSYGADAVYGADTYNGVRCFQRVHSLETDGIVGKETTRALDGAWIGD